MRRVAWLLISVLPTLVSAVGYVYEGEAKLEALSPRGLRASIPDEPDRPITLFAFHANINQELEGVDAGQIAKDILRPKNGRWTYEDRTTSLKKGDVVYYWLYVVYNGLGYQKLFQNWTVTDLVLPGGGVAPTTQRHDVGTVTTQTSVQPDNCQSVTRVNNVTQCSGAVVFEENFDDIASLDQRWSRDVYFPGAPNYEFVAYVGDARNSFVRAKQLVIKPSLTEERYGNKFVRNREPWTLEGCTSQSSEKCTKQSAGQFILPSVLSSRISTKDSFSFRYGTLELRAKLPAGDWIVPELWLEPKKKSHLGISGHIFIALALGNARLVTSEGASIGAELLRSGAIVEGLSQKKKLEYPHRVKGALWTSEYHLFKVIWTPDLIAFAVDGVEIGQITPGAIAQGQHLPNSRASIAPFDDEFYIRLGVRVGGFNIFPDGSTSGNDYTKPWTDESTRAALNFWETKDNWYPTWHGENAELRVDYVKVTAL